MSQERFHILEPRISSPLREEYRQYAQGVAVLIFNRNGEILLLKEGHEDPLYGRKKGDWNILTETRELDERIKSNIIHGLEQEVSRDYSEFVLIPGTYRETNATYNETMGYVYKYRCICLIFDGDSDIPANELFHCSTDEITDYQWVKLGDLHGYHLEQGVREVIEYYTNPHG